MLRILKTTLLLIFFNTLPAQNHYSLQGNVSSNDDALTYGDVLLLSSDEEKLIAYKTLNKGHFNFEEIKEGTYVLKISCLGFVEFRKRINLDKDKELEIRLTESTTALDEVEITATKQAIENKNGNMIVNIENTIFSKESNPIDLLSKLPKIQIANNRESISVVGKGTALIYLGNQRISTHELQNIAIEDIKTIEIISNPSSKYEASGRSVILITSKFSKKDGIKGSISETASFRKNYNNFFASNVSFKKSKLEFKFNVAYNDLHPWESNGSDYSITNKNIESSYLVAVDDTKRPQFIFGEGFYYQLNEHDYLSLSSTLRSQKDQFLIKTNSSHKENNIENHVFTISDNDDYRFYSSTNVNFNKSFKKTRNLFIGGQYSYFNKALGSDIGNSLNGSEIILDQKRLQDFKVNVTSLKTDFENEFANKSKLEIGASVSVINAKTDAQTSIVNPSSNFMSSYNYKEKNYAAYSQLSGKAGKLSYSSGVRAEITDGKGGFLNNSTLLVDRNNVKLFPKAMLAFEIDSARNLTLNYAKSVVRPNFTTISSSSTYINPFLEWKGNVELKPTITNEISLNYNFKNYAINTSYYLKENPVFYNIAYNDASETSTMSSTNFEDEEGFNLELVVPLKYKFWNSTTVVDFVSKRISDKNAIEFKASPYLYIYSNHQFKIDNTFSASLSGWGYTKHKEGIYKRNGVFAVNASLTKKFLKKIDATLSFNDVFKSLRFKEAYNVNNVRANTIFFTDANEISISIKYSFGKLKESSYKNKNVDENLNRIN